MASVRGHLIPESDKLTINITVHLYLLFKTLLSDQILNFVKTSAYFCWQDSFQIMLMELIIPEVIWGCYSISLFIGSSYPWEQEGRGVGMGSIHRVSNFSQNCFLFSLLNQKVTEGTTVLLLSITLVSFRNIVLFYNDSPKAKSSS